MHAGEDGGGVTRVRSILYVRHRACVGWMAEVRLHDQRQRTQSHGCTESKSNCNVIYCTRHVCLRTLRIPSIYICYICSRESSRTPQRGSGIVRGALC